VWKACAPLLLSGLAACAAPRSPSPKPAAASPAARFEHDPAAIERGRLIFVGTCGAYCHSIHNVQRDAPSLFDCEWKHGGSDQEIFHSISAGIPGTRMPAWGGALPEGDDDIWRVIAYLRSASTCNKPQPTPAH
jgi:mono/diheme cytochrome c family protein